LPCFGRLRCRHSRKARAFRRCSHAGVDLGVICTAILFSKKPRCLTVVLHFLRLDPSASINLAAQHHAPFCVAVPDASAFRTSDWEMPNCRAMRDGVMPALKAARTALSCPRVNEAVRISDCRLRTVLTALRMSASWSISSMLGKYLIAFYEVVQEFRCGGNARDQQMIPCAGAGDVEKMTLGVVDLLQIGILADRFDTLL
jgi:hypothetical protein